MHTDIYVKSLEEKIAKQKRALMVFILDPRIRGWLAENDPKALQQAREALNLGNAIARMCTREEADDFAALFTENE